MRRTRIPIPYDRMRRTKVPAGCERLRFEDGRINPEDEVNCSMHLWASPRNERFSADAAYSQDPLRRRFARSKWEPCVYFLISKGRVIYIGASVCVKQRLKVHFKDGKRFDEVRLLPKQNHKEVEKRMIKAFQPPLNVEHNPSRTWRHPSGISVNQQRWLKEYKKQGHAEKQSPSMGRTKFPPSYYSRLANMIS